MISSFYTASTGVVQLQKGMDVTANNIANLSTTGYKPSAPSFSDLIYTNINAAANSNTALKSGHGTKLGKTDTLFTTGTPRSTGRSLDFALTQPNQFFAVRSKGTVQYTRGGNFHLSVQQGGNYLVDSAGGYVLDAGGQPIKLANDQSAVRPGVFTFANCDGLERSGDSYFTATAVSGAATAAANPEWKQGALEDSSADMSTEMASVIELQRAFQMNSKVVQMSDEIMQTLNALR